MPVDNLFRLKRGLDLSFEQVKLAIRVMTMKRKVGPLQISSPRQPSCLPILLGEYWLLESIKISE